MILNSKGLTLIEIMISMALFVASVACYLSMYMIYSKSRAETNAGQIEKELLLQNIMEIKGSRFASLPTKNQCVVRTYSKGKELKNESRSAMTGNSCPRPAPGSDIVIIWEVRGTTGIDVTFAPAAGLKLPQYVDTLRKFDLISRAEAPKDASQVNEINFSIYRRLSL